jgi:hypothetical protein
VNSWTHARGRGIEDSIKCQAQLKRRMPRHAA